MHDMYTCMVYCNYACVHLLTTRALGQPGHRISSDKSEMVIYDTTAAYFVASHEISVAHKPLKYHRSTLIKSKDLD